MVEPPVVRADVLSAPAGPAGRTIALWTGCVAGALVADDYRDKLHSAGFTAVDLQPTQIFDRGAVQAVVADADPARIPADIDIETVVEALAGNVTSTFVRAVKPTT